ncbi:antibiotic biosynthesis monooxygenase [Oscillatoria sp. FACHB-1407]|uniref:antibiotic biosynthesis monooxygenase n=1 Tax=Oscillatoria sp. FACHB-1407 TaxID=2692847 RepID=UPI0016867AEF|nr:antibiotic biosynthesis monooxygenase [Oscillatoria sp. FACHB-1407]MBD2460033.1 antibiotic biosynthesis monooxygenase [Oscillatoria sp. FACHB-1407]
MTYSPSTQDYHVTAVINHLIKPGREEGYEEWLHGIVPVAKTFEGHLGVQILRPRSGEPPEYTIVLHFDQHAHLQAWLESKERHDWIERVQPLIQQSESIQVLTGLETWFQLPGRPQKTPPKRYKVATVTWLGVLLLSLLIGRFLAPYLAWMPWLVRQMVTSALVVWLLAYVVMPQLTRLFYGWLYPQSRQK